MEQTQPTTDQNTEQKKDQVQKSTQEQQQANTNEETKETVQNNNDQEEEEKLISQTQQLLNDMKMHSKTQNPKKEYQMQPITEEQYRKMTSEERQLYIKQLELSKKGQFWVTQPVPQYKENTENTNGPIDAIKQVKDVRQDPYPTLEQFEWTDVDLTNDDMMLQVYTLLKENYVEDDDNMFRFDYSIDFLRWALQPPGYYKEWIVGLQTKKKKKLCAFITGIPLKLNVEDKQIKVAEINFLCVHKNLRAHRLAPVLIKEITRRVNLKNIWQAVYTAGVIIPTPISQTQYFHRSLNPKKLIEANFSCLGVNQTKSRLIKLYKLPDKQQIPGVRPMMKKDISKVTKLLNDYLKQFQLYCKYTEEEVKYWFTPKKNVIYTYVIEQQDKQILDFFSFYYLPSQILKHPQHDTLRACYSYYNVATTVSLTDLIQEALIFAKQENFDVYNALNIMQNKEFLQELKFSPGDGNLNYYLYNWRLACKEFRPEQLGMVLV